MQRTRVTIPVAGDDAVSGVLTIGTQSVVRPSAGVILAHGAGNDMEHPLLVSLTDGLAEAGRMALRFNFPYKEKGRRAPDAPNKLAAAWQAAYAFLKARIDDTRVPIWGGGKSMGGRVASQMAAEGLLPVDGLIFLGYPLHPPGKPEKLRDTHLYRLRIPMLFFAGTRDTLCRMDLLQKVLAKLTAPWALETIEGGDHSFGVLKSLNVSPEAVYRRILEKTIAWTSSHGA